MSVRPSQAFVSGYTPLVAALLLVACLIAPVCSLLISAANVQFDQWVHLTRFVLPNAILNTVLLSAGVSMIVILIGTGAAWLVTFYRFPGCGVITWALVLPLAVPTYVVAYAYLDLFHPIGYLQGLIRTALGYSSPREFRLADIRSMWGAIIVMASVLYPYVYLTARQMFLTQPANLIEVARALGHGPFSLFVRVALPMARPAVVVGTTLALFELLNDVGASEFLGVRTVTVAIYTTWITRSDLAGAIQIALVLSGIVLCLLTLERYAVKRQRFNSTDISQPLRPHVLQGLRGFIASVICSLPVVAGFVLPMSQLVWRAISSIFQTELLPLSIIQALANTVMVAGAVTVCCVAGGILLTWTARNWVSENRSTHGQWLARIAYVGYALPAVVLAIGALAPLALLGEGINAVTHLLVGARSRQWLMGTIFGLIFVCSLRFLPLASGSIAAGFSRVSIALDQSARALGHSPSSTFLRISLPLLFPAIFGAACLVFVETMKELSITILLRPLGFETLSTLIYAEAARGAYEEGALAALLIVLVGIVPVILLTRIRTTSTK